jgi:hypothetical protein
MQYRKLTDPKEILSNVRRYRQLSKQFRTRSLTEILAGHDVYEREHSLTPVTFTWEEHEYEMWFRCICGKHATIARRCVRVDGVTSNGNILRKLENTITFELMQIPLPGDRL